MNQAKTFILWLRKTANFRSAPKTGWPENITPVIYPSGVSKADGLHHAYAKA